MYAPYIYPYISITYLTRNSHSSYRPKPRTTKCKTLPWHQHPQTPTRLSWARRKARQSRCETLFLMQWIYLNNNKKAPGGLHYWVFLAFVEGGGGGGRYTGNSLVKAIHFAACRRVPSKRLATTSISTNKLAFHTAWRCCCETACPAFICPQISY